MAASLQEIQHRIESTKSTRQITSAMQMVSTANCLKFNALGMDTVCTHNVFLMLSPI
ncbi:F0F1 ATP synthase subunit gamma [Weissella viridescens]|uniref:F0F1 ATP synthase subunit gamma n=1 Tax=Weissella viridescens TaxID=1629 RepID=A0A380NWZ8_WEIVI|nr:F0F1 ATP synthase subunit gamma [Weissella viridescens]